VQENQIWNWDHTRTSAHLVLFCLWYTSSMLSWNWDYANSSAVSLSFHRIVWLSHKSKTPDYKYWMPTLVKEITVLQIMDWVSLHLLQLAKLYNRVYSAIMFTSLNSTINRSQTVISLYALCTLVFKRQFGVSRLLRLCQVGILWITIQWVLSSPIRSPTANTSTWRRQLMIMIVEQLRAHIKLGKVPVNVILFVVKSSALFSC